MSMTHEEAARILDPKTSAKVLREYGDGNAQITACDEACRIAAKLLRKCDYNATEMRPDRKPLTLEQLREMDGKPVWIVEAPHWGRWELSEDAEDYIIDRHEEFYGLKYNDPEGKHGLHKLGWLAYAYPPAHIDREAWKSCKLCEKYKVFQFNAWEKPEMSLGNIDCMGTSLFCPHCGRPLTKDAWAELEKRLNG